MAGTFGVCGSKKVKIPVNPPLTVSLSLSGHIHSGSTYKLQQRTGIVGLLSKYIDTRHVNVLVLIVGMSPESLVARVPAENCNVIM
jgi:hypothetical protein